VKLARHTGSAAYARVASAISFARFYAVPLVLLLLLGLGAYVRLHGLSDTTVSFNNTRQMHCAIITRALHLEWTQPVSDPRRIVAEQQRQRRGQLEPPIIEHLAAIGFSLSGGEHFWIVRLLGSAFWLAGTVFLYSLGRSLLSPVAGLIAAAYFALVPFGVVASQSFQPDPLMMMLMLASFACIARNDRAPKLSAALLAGVVSGVAVLVKPVCGPVIVALYAALTFRRRGFVRALLSIETWLVASLLLIPTAVYYLGEIASGGRRSAQAAGTFMPDYWRRPDFWPNWRTLATAVCGGPYVVSAALLGLVLAPAGRARVALWALLAGYIAFGFAFPYHIATHDYYQLQLLPIVGVALGALFQRAYSAVPRLGKHAVMLGFSACAIAMLVLTVRDVQAHVWPRTHVQPSRDRHYVAIGELVNHSTRVIFLDPNKYGSELEYEGELSGWRWPTRGDLRRARRKGAPELDWYGLLQERMSQGAEFLVSRPTDELLQQRKLLGYIESHHPRISDSPEYVVYDLRRRR
jgi:hypothetical protein